MSWRSVRAWARGIALGASLLVGAVAQAAGLPIGYGGRLTAADGSPLTGAVDLTFAFFDAATGGHALRGAPVEVKGVALAHGVFQVDLALTAADLDALFAGGGAVWVEVTDATHGKTYPRQKFLAVPYALRVPVDGTSVVYDSGGNLSVGAVDAAKVTGLATMLADMGNAAKLQGVPLGTGTPAAGAVLTYQGGQWLPVTDSGVLTQRGNAAPAVAPAGEGRIYFDATSNQFMVSQNGGAYAPLGTVTGGVITQVSAGNGLTGGGTTGNVTVGMPSVGTAGTYTRVLTDAYGRVTAGGPLTAADLPSIPVGLVSGTLAASQVPVLTAAQIQGGTLAASVIPPLSAAQITAGTLAAAQLPSLSEAQITSGTLSVALGGTGATSFPSGGVVVGAGSLPLSTVSAGSQYQVLQQGASGPTFGPLELGQSAAVSGTLTVAHLPPIPAGLVTGSLAAAQISGTLAAAQVGTIPVTQLSGTFTAAQLPGIPATSITGSLGAAQISGTLAATQLPSLPASQVIGTLAAAQVAPIPASQITGSLAAAQISGTLATAALPSLPAGLITGSLPVAQLSGTLAASQVGPIPVSQITGTLVANQVGPVPTSQISGTLAASQVAALPVSQITGTLAAAQVAAIPVAQLSGTLTTAQLPSIPTSQLSGTLAAAQVAPIPTTQITGTLATAQHAAAGTSGQVQFNGAGVPTADANFVWDNTGKRLGIGSAAPGAALDVAGEIRQTYGGDTSRLMHMTDPVFTGNPSTVFNTGSQISGLSINAQKTNPGFWTGLNIYGTDVLADATNYENFLIATGTGTGVAGSATTITQGKAGTGTYRDLAFVLGGSEKLRLTSSGSVGIGSVSPAYALDVAGTGRFTGDIGVGGITGTNVGVYVSGTPVSTASQYAFDANVTFGPDATTRAASYWAAPLTTAAAYTVPDLYGYFAGNVSKGAGSSVTNQYGFYAAPLTSAGSNWAVYTAGSTPSYFGGNVGIGTTTPQTSLQIASAAVTGNTPTVLLENTSGANASAFGPGVALNNHVAGTHPFVLQQWQTPDSRFSINNYLSPYTEYLTITQGGNVGIGTSSPSAQLQIAPAGTGGVAIILGTNTSSGGYTTLAVQTSAASGGYSSLQSTMSSGSAWGTLSLNPSGGSVGIGTTSPAVALDVSGGIRPGSSTTVTTCNATVEGTQRYNYTSHKMEYCNGTSWTAYFTSFTTSTASASVASGTAGNYSAFVSCPAGTLVTGCSFDTGGMAVPCQAWVNGNGCRAGCQTNANVNVLAFCAQLQ